MNGCEAGSGQKKVPERASWYPRATNQMAFVTVLPDVLKGTGGKEATFRANWETYTVDSVVNDHTSPSSCCHVELLEFRGSPAQCRSMK